MIDVEQRSRDPRSFPDCSSDWNTDSMRRPLWHAHRRKCYSCERELNYGNFEVEHRVPRAQFPQLTHCWLNLFPVCRFCNGRRKGCPYPERGGLLSPGTDSAIEERLNQAVIRESSTEIRARFAARDPSDIYAYNTARELEHIHDPDTATTDTARANTLDHLDAIEDYYTANVYPLEVKVLRARRRGEPDAFAEDELRRSVSRDRPYTMLVRSLIHTSLHELFD